MYCVKIGVGKSNIITTIKKPIDPYGFLTHIPLWRACGRSERFARTGYGTWMLWDNSSAVAVVALARFFLDNVLNKL